MKTINMRVGVAVAVAVMCALVAGESGGKTGAVEVLKGIEEQPGWAVPYGREHWRGLATNGTAGRRSLDDVLERVSYSIRAEGEGFVVRSGAYAAWFDAEGFRLSTSAGRQSGELAFRTRRVAVGTNVLFDAADGARGPVRKVVLCNTAQALLNPALRLVEHVEVRGGGLAVTWLLREHVPVDEELVVRVGLDGAVFVCATSAGFHFSDGADGRDFLVRRAVATDRRGWPWPVAMVVVGDGVVLKLSQRCMLEAYRPLVIESRVEPSVAFGGGEAAKAGGPAPAVKVKDGPAPTQAPVLLVNMFVAARAGTPLEPIPLLVTRAAAPSFHTEVEVATLMEMRDQLVLFHGLAWSQVNDGIPHDRDTISAQAESWSYLADSREEKGRRDFETFQLHLERARVLLGSYSASACRDEAWQLSQKIENFTIHPFTAEGESETVRLESGIREKLPAMYHGFRARGEEPFPIFVSLRAAVRDAGMFHYYVTAARATRAGVAADWAARLAEYDARSNHYAAVRGPLFARNVAVARTIGGLGEATDAWLEKIRAGTDDSASFRMFDGRMRDLRAAIRNAPMASCGDQTIASQLGQLRLTYSELLNAKLDLSGYTSPHFNAARVETRLAAIEAKLQNAFHEAGRQLTQPDETSWQMLGIRSVDEARDVLKQRTVLTEKFGMWLRLVQDWRAALARQPDNNFATLNFLSSFVRNKAEWDHLMATEVYPVAWHYPPFTISNLLTREEFRKGAMVETSVNAMLADLQDVWSCYGDY